MEHAVITLLCILTLLSVVALWGMFAPLDYHVGRGYSVRVLLDSISPADRRLTTWILRYPRFVHAELMTHRILSRNAASSRAIPIMKMIRQVLDDPAMPVWWGRNQSGMQAREELQGWRLRVTRRLWLLARYGAVAAAWLLWKVGLHKQIANRVLEPWMFITVIVSATSYDNWFHLRNHRDAQPEIAWVAREMHRLYGESQPRRLEIGEWHLPFVDDDQWHEIIDYCNLLKDGEPLSLTETAKKISTGRIARVSLLNHDGKRVLADDVKLHDRLLAGAATGDPLHMSPFEHVAQCLADPNEQSGNFKGWKQYRKMIPNEHFGEVMP